MGPLRQSIMGDQLPLQTFFPYFFSPDKVMSPQDGLSAQRRVSYLNPETYLMNQNTLSQFGFVI